MGVFDSQVDSFYLCFSVFFYNGKFNEKFCARKVYLEVFVFLHKVNQKIYFE